MQYLDFKSEKELQTIAFDLMSISNLLKTNLTRAYTNGENIPAQDVERISTLHEQAIKLQEIAEGLE